MARRPPSSGASEVAGAAVPLTLVAVVYACDAASSSLVYYVSGSGGTVLAGGDAVGMVSVNYAG